MYDDGFTGFSDANLSYRALSGVTDDKFEKEETVENLERGDSLEYPSRTIRLFATSPTPPFDISLLLPSRRHRDWPLIVCLQTMPVRLLLLE